MTDFVASEVAPGLRRAGQGCLACLPKILLRKELQFLSLTPVLQILVPFSLSLCINFSVSPFHVDVNRHIKEYVRNPGIKDDRYRARNEENLRNVTEIR